ncbi:MAG: hypothetical protein M3335_00280 [Actinomycetota bacterium]|nr:hypothetical protein [Actinomycetota bacterium]
MLRTLAIACAPLVTVWATTAAFTWCTSPERRGTAAVRRRDLRAPKPEGADDSGIVDLSRHAAAYGLGIRVGGLVRGTSYLLVITCALFHSNLILSLAGLAAAIWIGNRSHKAAGLAFFAAAGNVSVAFKEAAWAYQFPLHERGWIYHFFHRGPGNSLSILGVSFIGMSGLPFAYNSDALVTGIPGLYVQHSHLPLWLIGAILFIVGTVLAMIGARLTRDAQRREMRAETRINPRRFGESPAAVFLRPFGSDLLTVPSHPGPRRETDPLLALPRPRDFLENVVTWLFWANGEVLAIAQPSGGQTKTVGAAHHPLRPDMDWQAAVSKLLKKTTSIVIVPGPSSGIAWEIHTVLSDPELARKALIVNPNPQHDPADFLATIGAPHRTKDLTRRHLRALAAFITPAGPILLCSSLAEDIDFEMAVEWFLRHQPSKGTSFWHRAQDFADKLGLTKESSTLR